MIYNFTLIACLLSSLAAAQTSIIQNWKYIVKGDSGKLQTCVRNNQTFIPFINAKVNNSLLDNLSKQGLVHDSLLILYNEKQIEYLPEPVVDDVGGKSILFKEHFSIEAKGSNYNVYVFLLSKNSEINEHDCFELYYIPSIGSVAAFHIVLDEWHLFRNWDRYLLVDIRRKEHAIKNKTLRQLTAKVIEHCQCSLY